MTRCFEWPPLVSRLELGVEKMIKTQPSNNFDLRPSRRSFRTVDVGVPNTVAGGQQGSIPGAFTWPATNRLTSDFATVSDDEIVAAMQLLHSARG